MASVNVDGVSALLLSTHMLLASITKTPELVIDQDESKALGSALARVAECYDVGVMSPEAMAWLGLAQALGVVYGPRLFAVRARKSMEAAERKRTAPTADVYAHGDFHAGFAGTTAGVMQ